MTYKIVITQYYLKKLNKFIRKHPDILNSYEKAMQLLEKDPYHKSLRIHKLKGKLKTYYSMSINIEYRIIIDFIIEDKQIIPIDIGSHNEVY